MFLTLSGRIKKRHVELEQVSILRRGLEEFAAYATLLESRQARSPSSDALNGYYENVRLSLTVCYGDTSERGGAQGRRSSEWVPTLSILFTFAAVVHMCKRSDMLAALLTALSCYKTDKQYSCSAAWLHLHR